jgi:Cu+-exporting ATPase
VEYANAKHLNLYQVDQFESHTGFGISGSVNGKSILTGSKRLLEQYSVKTNHWEQKEIEISKEGKVVIFVAINNELKGLIAIDDPVKKGAAEAIKEIKSLGITTVMLSGDSKFSSSSVAEKIVIDEFEAEVLPEEKIGSVKAYQSKGETVAMVGDGINDSPALAQSDVGIAIGTGTDVAIETADIVLISGNLNGVVKSIKLSKRAIRTVKQNLFWAFIYNVTGVPLAAFGILNPIFAALAMSLSSLSVISNSLRLKRMKL